MNEKNLETPIEEVTITDATDNSPSAGCFVTPAQAGAAAMPPVGGGETAALRDELAAMSDKYLRTAAELENTRRRATLDADNAARVRAMSVATKFLPLVDAIVSASAHNPDDTGVQSMVRALDSTLAQIGITRIETVGAQLNPQFHNAISVVDAPDTETNTITAEMQAGYMFGDIVMRPAMVIVAK